MENEPAGKASINAREEIVQPLLTIQQYALMQLQQLKKEQNPSKEQIDNNGKNGYPFFVWKY
jgi:phosphoenolpyruvate carboxylase